MVAPASGYTSGQALQGYLRKLLKENFAYRLRL